jgi:hypothetical protein
MPQGVDKGAVRSCIQRLTAAAQRLKEAQERLDRSAKESAAAQKAPGGQPAVGASDPTFAFGALASARTTAAQELDRLREEAERHLNVVRRGVSSDGQDLSALERAVSEARSGHDGLNAARGAVRQDRRDLEKLQEQIEHALQVASSAQQSGGSGGSHQGGGSSGSPYLSSGFSSRPSLDEQLKSAPAGGRREGRGRTLGDLVAPDGPVPDQMWKVIEGIGKGDIRNYRSASAPAAAASARGGETEGNRCARNPRGP